VVGAALEQTQRRGFQLTKVVIRDASGHAELVFFNQPWLKDAFARLKNQQVSVYGQVSFARGDPTFTTPEWEPLTDDGSSLHVNRIVPIHPSTEGLTPKMLRGMVANALARYGDLVPDLLPPAIRGSEQLAEMRLAIHQIHFPDSPQTMEAARRRLVFDELFLLQIALAMRKQAVETGLPGITFEIKAEHVEEFVGKLPFELTSAQRRVIEEIHADMGRPRPMNRLLQGDVGSGKTVVAAAAILAAVRSGYQAAMMVPTEILAEQHYTVVSRLLEPFGVKVHRLVGSVRAKGKKLIKEELASGIADMVIGTHALIQETVEFHRLGLVIIDEQHRFGVLQRMMLLDKGQADLMPDVLVMTATPIPRTLALTVYGDLEVSVLDELPPDRKPVRTHWKRKDQREGVYRGVRQLVAEGKQVYFLCPLVEESEKLQARAATEMAEHLQSEVFPDLRVGLIHGQMPSYQKDETMERFREREIDLLVATVVIEVGVDVPNACCMVIEDAERFGLAQLHQLRGRVGRGADQSFCIMLADPRTEEGLERVRAMVRTTDGFELAEEDLRLRGPGEFYGTRQSGILKLRIANIVGDTRILERARACAFELVASDPGLQRPEHQPLRRYLESRFTDLMLAATG
jgi:ATP-dependent DNA helicase RecG